LESGVCHHIDYGKNNIMSKKKRCNLCDVELQHNIIGLNKKMLGRNIQKYFCINCLAEYLEVTTEVLLEKIEDFKTQGCTLFK
jgi:hypothetical protein